MTLIQPLKVELLVNVHPCKKSPFQIQLRNLVRWLLWDVRHCYILQFLVRLQIIGEEAFEECTSLQQISIKNAHIIIGRNALGGL